MRLGDDIDDYCSRCKFSSDHSVVSLVGDEVKKVRCRTCQTEHNYRHNKGSKEMTAQEAFAKVLASVTGQQAGSDTTATPAKKPRKK